MRKLIAGSVIFAAFTVVSGCAMLQSPDPITPEITLARQNVKIYDVMPANGTPIEQMNATACNGTQEAATDKLLIRVSQRGGNGIVQLVCTTGGFSFSCLSSVTCTGTAINVVAPPPPPPPVLRRTKSKAKKKI
jgi:hypothetical protein